MYNSDTVMEWMLGLAAARTALHSAAVLGLVVYPLLFHHATLHAIIRRSKILRQRKTASECELGPGGKVRRARA